MTTEKKTTEQPKTKLLSDHRLEIASRLIEAGPFSLGIYWGRLV